MSFTHADFCEDDGWINIIDNGNGEAPNNGRNDERKNVKNGRKDECKK